MRKILVKETASTNTFMFEELRRYENLEEGTLFYTPRQTAGRGQIGNHWESEPEKNIAFSLLLRPVFLPIREQFLLSEITSLAVVETLSSQLSTVNPKLKKQTPKPSIKWPNDIYLGDEKVCGMLIENSLMGCELRTAVIGVGINVNQTLWLSDAPNPTSLKLCCGRDFVVEEVLDEVLDRLSAYYEKLRAGEKEEIHRRYIANLYRRDGLFPYKDTATGCEFMARIADVEPTGHLLLEDSEGKTLRYMFKEVKFVLPCGVTKE